jgi:hypothetical protein
MHLLFWVAITNYHKLDGLKQHTFILFPVLEARDPKSPSAGFLEQGIIKAVILGE